MWTRIPYSARIGLPVRRYVREAARKPILPLRKNTEKYARNATEFLISVDLGKVWPPLVFTATVAVLVPKYIYGQYLYEQANAGKAMWKLWRIGLAK